MPNDASSNEGGAAPVWILHDKKRTTRRSRHRNRQSERLNSLRALIYAAFRGVTPTG